MEYSLITINFSLWAGPAPRIIHRSISNGVIGLEKRIEASIDEPKKFLWAKIYVKKAFDGSYLPVPMQGSGRNFFGLIPQEYMVKAGTRYYIEVTFQDNSRSTLPSGAPTDNYLIKNQSVNEKINISILVPKPNQRLTTKIPKMTASIRGLDYINSKDSIKVYLDKQEVTARIKFGFVQYSGKSAISPGAHTFEVVIFDEKGTKIGSQTRDFTVVGSLTPAEEIRMLEEQKKLGKNVKKKVKWKTSGNFGTTYQFAKTVKSTTDNTETTVPYPNGYYNFTGQFKASNGNTSFFIGPFSITSQKAEGGNRIHQFSFGFQRDKFSTKWGQISSQVNPLTASGVSMLGGEFYWQDMKAKDKPGFNFKVFTGQTKIPLDGNVDPNGLGVYSQRVYGAQIDYMPIPWLGVFSLAAVDVRDDKSSIKNASFIPIVSNQSASLLAKINMPKFTSLKGLEIEIAANTNKTEVFVVEQLGIVPNITETIGWGVQMKTSGELKFINTNYGVQSKFMNPNFFTALGSSVADIIQVGGNLSHTLFNSKVALAEKFDYSFDNLEGQKDTTTTTMTGNVSLAISLAPLPTITVTDNLQQQSNDALEALKTVNNSFSASTAYTFTLSSFSINTGFAYSQNDTLDLSASTNPADDIRVKTYAPSLSIAPFSFIDLSGSYNFSTNENLTKGGINTTTSMSLSGNLKLFSNKITLPLGFSRSNTFDDKNPQQTNTRNDNYQSGIQWSMNKQQKLNINGSYAITTDFLNSDNNFTNLSITVTYNATL